MTRTSRWCGWLTSRHQLRQARFWSYCSTTAFARCWVAQISDHLSRFRCLVGFPRFNCWLLNPTTSARRSFTRPSLLAEIQSLPKKTRRRKAVTEAIVVMTATATQADGERLAQLLVEGN